MAAASGCRLVEKGRGSMLFKVMNETGQSAHGVDVTHADHLPQGNEAGPWMRATEGPLVYQEHGYHCGDESQILEWLGPVIYAVENEGEMLEVPRAKVARRIRLTRKCTSWTEQAARQFAVECALRVLEVFEAVSDNTAPRDAIAKAAAAPASPLPSRKTSIGPLWPAVAGRGPWRGRTARLRGPSWAGVGWVRLR